MTIQHSGLDISLEADGDVSSHQYKFAKISADGQAALGGANDTDIIGIFQDVSSADAAGKACTVRVSGTSKLKVNEAINEGSYITSTSTGLGENVDAANEPAFAKALEAATAQNDVITVLIIPGGAEVASGNP